jgi:hypothetical protein
MAEKTAPQLLRMFGVALLIGLLTFALLVGTWILATSDVGMAFRAQSAWYKLGVAALVGFVTLLIITHWLNLRQQWIEFAKTVSALAPLFVKPALLFLLGIVLFIAYHVMAGKEPFTAAADDVSMALLGVLFLSSSPALLTLGVSLLVERRMANKEFFFEVSPSIAEKEHGAKFVEQARANWDYERELMEGSVHRMGRHAAILGFLASSIFITCIAIRFTRGDYVALAVGTSATISFTLHLGQIYFRSASNDATARMMARASRTLLIVSICALFFGFLFLENKPETAVNANPPPQGQPQPGVPVPPPPAGGTQATGGTAPQGPANSPLRGETGALLIGIAVALIGERMLQVVTHRAASLLGVEGFSEPQAGDLSVIDGLNAEDAARLAEERIDSVHALAFTPTARIFFNTIYGLPRICDWQDQALLIERVGRTNALLLREQFFIRGAIAARQLAIQTLLKSVKPAEQVPPKPETVQDAASQGTAPAPQAQGAQGAPAPQPEVPSPLREPGPGMNPPAQEISLDIERDSHLNRALRSLINDENIERLEVFWRSVPVLKESEEPRPPKAKS